MITTHLQNPTLFLNDISHDHFSTNHLSPNRYNVNNFHNLRGSIGFQNALFWHNKRNHCNSTVACYRAYIPYEGFFCRRWRTYAFSAYCRCNRMALQRAPSIRSHYFYARVAQWQNIELLFQTVQDFSRLFLQSQQSPKIQRFYNLHVEVHPNALFQRLLTQ